MPRSSAYVPRAWGVQVTPPSIVRRIVPDSPTAVPVLASTKETPCRLFVVPLDWDVHVAPPSVVRRMVPKSPTATTVLGSKVATPDKRFPWGSGFCQYQPDWAKDPIGCKAVNPDNRNKTVFVLMVSPLVSSIYCHLGANRPRA